MSNLLAKMTFCSLHIKPTELNFLEKTLNGGPVESPCQYFNDGMVSFYDLGQSLSHELAFELKLNSLICF